MVAEIDVPSQLLLPEVLWDETLPIQLIEYGLVVFRGSYDGKNWVRPKIEERCPVHNLIAVVHMPALFRDDVQIGAGPNGLVQPCRAEELCQSRRVSRRCT